MYNRVGGTVIVVIVFTTRLSRSSSHGITRRDSPVGIIESYERERFETLSQKFGAFFVARGEFPRRVGDDGGGEEGFQDGEE